MTQKQARMLVRKLTNLMAAEVCFSNDPGRETADYVNRHEARVVKQLLEIFPEEEDATEEFKGAAVTIDALMGIFTDNGAFFNDGSERRVRQALTRNLRTAVNNAYWAGYARGEDGAVERYVADRTKYGDA